MAPTPVLAVPLQGCGSGLPGLVALWAGAEVHFQVGACCWAAVVLLLLIGDQPCPPLYTILHPHSAFAISVPRCLTAGCC